MSLFIASIENIPIDEVSKLKDLLDYRTTITFLALLIIAVVGEFTAIMVMVRRHALKLEELNKSFSEELRQARDEHLATAVQAVPVLQRVTPLIEEIIKIIEARGVPKSGSRKTGTNQVASQEGSAPSLGSEPATEYGYNKGRGKR